jgi:hypothetical protein
MYTKEQADEKMAKFIASENILAELNYGENFNIIVYEHLTQVRDFGWVFFWQVKDIKEDLSNVIVGNGPIIIEKDTLDMYQMGTAMEVEKSIEMYLKDKNSLSKLEMDEHGYFNVVNLDD